jgi:hypothetical protein
MVKLELDVNEVNLVLIAISKMPIETHLGLFGKIKTTAEEQLKPKE